ncbi:AraC family transcriptional regulator [uncultured Flavobacterium sp.]|uniref:helix-turn-helix domain-containing protein n=1 Tax=uncultured Flavobacterium sp. TaxID=165435 RepID=UPI0025D0EDE1|nr:helix-turn-helix transcriptional regulator [uncultured Flavobacterium sp.]
MKKNSVLHIGQFNDGDGTEEFYANTMQDHLQTRHKDIAHPHSHDFYVAMLFTQGSGTHEIDFTAYEVKPGALFFLNPGQTHHWELSADTEGYIFLHSQAFYDLHYTHGRISRFPFYFSMHQSPVIYTEASEQPVFVQLFQSIFAEYRGNSLMKKEALIGLADLTYISATRIYPIYSDESHVSENNYYNKFREFERLIEQNYRRAKSPSHYAGMMAITSRHLNRITQSVVGKPSIDVIQDRILLEAKKLLVSRRDSFSEISEALGYEDYGYFSRVFKNKAGVTPKGFLKQYGR